jgi:hypothetical protein
MRKLVIIGALAVLATSSACTPKPKQRSWVLHTETSRDDSGPRYLAYADIEALRAAALETRGAEEVSWYVRALAKYLWEVEPLLAARDRAASDPEYKYEAPPEIAGLDRAALLAEAEAMIVELETKGGWSPELEKSLLLVSADCKSISVEAAIELSCRQWAGDGAFDEAKAVCGEITTVCRETFDRMADPDWKYRLLDKCAKDMMEGTNSTEEQVLATWLSAEEMEFWNQSRATARAEGASILDSAESARRDAQEENERRIAEYEANGGPPPDLIESVGIDITHEAGPVQYGNETVTLVIDNQCDQQASVMDEATGKYQIVPPGERKTFELRRCAVQEIKTPGGRRPVGMSRPASFVLRSDCETLDSLRPETSEN